MFIEKGGIIRPFLLFIHPTTTFPWSTFTIWVMSCLIQQVIICSKWKILRGRGGSDVSWYKRQFQKNLHLFFIHSITNFTWIKLTISVISWIIQQVINLNKCTLLWVWGKSIVFCSERQRESKFCSIWHHRYFNFYIVWWYRESLRWYGREYGW